jgi:hypothetical protein
MEKLMESNSTIPVPANNPFEPQPNTTDFLYPGNAYTCPGCGAWVSYGFYHQCPGPTRIITTDSTNLFGGLAEISAYSDFLKLLKRDTIAKFREQVIEKLLEIEQNTPEDHVPIGFGFDVIEEVFDDVAKDIGNKGGV